MYAVSVHPKEPQADFSFTLSKVILHSYSAQTLADVPEEVEVVKGLLGSP